MRDIGLVLVVLFFLTVTLRYPYTGVLLWGWFTLMDPHQATFGFARSAPFNLVIAIVTLIAWLVSSEPKYPPKSVIIGVTVAFLAWMTFNSFFAVEPDWSWQLWNRTWKIFAFALLATAMTINKVRFHALIWVVVISLCYYGVKGGVFTLATGGSFRVNGIPGTPIGDNNQFALAMTAMLPLMNYLRLHTASRMVRGAIVVCVALVVVAILGSYSRGGFISLASLALVFWFRASQKLVYPVVATIVLVPALQFMPERFYNRMNSIAQFQTDSSVGGRFDAWYVAYHYAIDHFPFGAGFSGPQLGKVFNFYLPGAVGHAAHSIYFQVLGEHGFVGLLLYILMIVLAFVTCSTVIGQTRKYAELGWAFDLAKMIQTSMIVFCIGGAALSMAYYDLFILCICLVTALRRYVDSLVTAKVAVVLPEGKLPLAPVIIPARLTR